MKSKEINAMLRKNISAKNIGKILISIANGGNIAKALNCTVLPVITYITGYK